MLFTVSIFKFIFTLINLMAIIHVAVAVIKIYVLSTMVIG